ncbi:Serine protease inhibitor 88Ea-like 5 [Homarus americanus]|uniref:Serine protease inhibitor 88Ea-like 5 n=1 Tax=Homarus americanus TaxID=6706 RepID=A0A8J5JK38_HOMAM|nr:Serine protease inhibitor 88Ea-like 5 [Homarus americanus]
MKSDGGNWGVTESLDGDERDSVDCRMLNFVSAVLLLTLVGVVSPQCITTNDTQSPPLHPDLGHILPFSLGLFKELYVPGSATGNFFFSPFSIWNALVLAYFGSAGRTREQLQRVLNLKNPADTLATYKAVDRLYAERQANNSDYVIDLANRMYVNVSFPIRDCVSQVLSEEVQFLNFYQNEAANKINQFVSETTRGKITQVVTPQDLKNVVMALINAAYFKGLWLTPFKTSLTSKDKFFTSPNQHTLVDMMNLHDYFKAGKSSELGARVLELPYKGEAASMFVLLPDSAATDDNTTTPLDAMLTRLTPYTLKAALATLRGQRVDIRIPKFKMEKLIKKELNEALQRLGIRDIFSDSADMSIFDPLRRLKVKETIHKAVIEVNEEGSEAAAATVGLIVPSTVPLRFICNRPFLFFIHDNHTNNILFMGVYRQP